jgi:hypothetical protein
MQSHSESVRVTTESLLGYGIRPKLWPVIIGYPEVIQIATWGSVPTSRLEFTDEAAHRQCRSGWMTRYRKLSESELSPSVPR